jgi:hypothetical protein
MKEEKRIQGIENIGSISSLGSEDSSISEISGISDLPENDRSFFQGIQKIKFHEGRWKLDESEHYSDENLNGEEIEFSGSE